MTPRQRASAYEALQRLEEVTYEDWDVPNLLEAIRYAAIALREALPNPDQPDQW